VNLSLLFRRALDRFPEKAALVFGEERLSYRTLLSEADGLARTLLRDFAVAPGDHVGLWFDNTPEFVIAYLATLQLGGVAISISPASKGPEVAYVARDSRPRVILTSRERSQGDIAREVPCPVLGLSRSEGDLHTSESLLPRALLTQALLPPVDRMPSDAASILYTSGTTGRPKGVVLTHGNLTTNTEAVARCIGAEPGDRHLLFLPLFHCFGQNFILNTALQTGGTVVLLRRFDPSRVLSVALEQGVTHFYGVPTVFRMLLELPDAPRVLEHVRYFFSAAAPLPVDVALRFRKTFGQVIHQGYGLTETSPLATYNHSTSYRPGSVGVPIEHVEMKVVDASGRSCGAMVEGEICIKGPNVMAGYFERPDETIATIEDGWLRTGDLGYRDQDGYYYLVDRIKDMINRAGFKVWPSEVEEVLSQHPAVKECAVVGVPDERLGERVCAYVTPRDGLRLTENQLDEHCRALLANYKLPEAYVLDAVIPRSPAGKVLRRMLRQRLSGEDG
jgi:long-chain acyl-CoA synthetase